MKSLLATNFRSRTSTWATLFVLAAFGSIAFYARGEAPNTRPWPFGYLDADHSIANKVGLTPEQTSKIEPLFNDANGKLAAAIKQSSGDKDAEAQTVKNVFSDLNKSLTSVLTEAQQKQLQESVRILDVMIQFRKFETQAIQAENDNSKSLQALSELDKHVGALDTRGCPDDFRLAFLGCSGALDRLPLHMGDLAAAKKLDGDRELAGLLTAVLAPHLKVLSLLDKSRKSTDPLEEKARLDVIADRDQYMEGQQKLAELMIKYGVTVPTATAPVAAPKTAANKAFTVRAKEEANIQISFPAEKTPGRLTGHWSSSGASAGIAGAHDDTIVKFTIKDSNNKIVQTVNHQASGNFDIRYNGGNYTLAFSNSGIVRASDRKISVEYTYEADSK